MAELSYNNLRSPEAHAVYNLEKKKFDLTINAEYLKLDPEGQNALAAAAMRQAAWEYNTRPEAHSHPDIADGPSASTGLDNGTPHPPRDRQAL